MVTAIHMGGVVTVSEIGRTTGIHMAIHVLDGKKLMAVLGFCANKHYLAFKSPYLDRFGRINIVAQVLQWV